MRLFTSVIRISALSLDIKLPDNMPSFLFSISPQNPKSRVYFLNSVNRVFRKPLPLSFVVGHQMVDDIHTRNQHSSAAIPLHPKRIQDFLWVFPSAYALDKFAVLVSDELSAGETSNWNYHSYAIHLCPNSTYRIFAYAFELQARQISWSQIVEHLRTEDERHNLLCAV